MGARKKKSKIPCRLIFVLISQKVIYSTKDLPVTFTGNSSVFLGNSLVKLKAISIKGISYVKLKAM